MAIAMMAGEGLDYVRAAIEVRAAYRKAANSALIFLALPGVTIDQRRHLSDRLDAMLQSLRMTADAMERDGGKGFSESLTKAAYANATAMETVARILRGEADPEPAAELPENPAFDDEEAVG